MKAKVFVCHTPGRESIQPQGSHFVHMLGGAVLYNKKIPKDVLGDDSGDNISKKNKSYCELTVQYWAWKNVEADYYGFCHYRRYFSFNTERLTTDDWGSVIRPYLNTKTVEELRLNDVDHIGKIIDGYDVITPVPVDLKNVNIPSVYEQYKTFPYLYTEDLDILLCIIEEKFPEYFNDAREYLFGDSLYLCNMFIMRRDIFFQYSRWLFDILSEFENRKDMAYYSEQSFRTPGHLGERLFGIFCHYLRNHSQCRFYELQLVTIADSSKVEYIKPAFGKNSVNIVLASSEYFAPYCATVIRSILDHIVDKERCYDIIILEQEILPKTKKMFYEMILGLTNVSIRFLNVKQKISDYQLRIREHFAVETYFRLVMADFLPQYAKILYLDCDLLIREDITTLFDIDISEYCLAGVADTALAGHINCFSTNKHRPYYLEKVKLKEKNLLRQINAGVALMNLSMIRSLYTCEELLEYAQAGNFDLCDQDVLNSLFQDNIFLLPNEWNVPVDEDGTLRAWVATFAPREMYQEYKKAFKSPKILHYCGTIKPWNDPGYELAYLFWDTLKMTPFYELVIHRRIVENAKYFSENKPTNTISLIHRIMNFFLPVNSKKRAIVKKIYYRLGGKK